MVKMSSASDMLVAFLSHDTSAIHGVNAEQEIRDETRSKGNTYSVQSSYQQFLQKNEPKRPTKLMINGTFSWRGDKLTLLMPVLPLPANWKDTFSE